MGLSTSSSGILLGRKTPAIPKMASVYIVRVEISRPPLCRYRTGDGTVPPWGWAPRQEFENKMTLLGLKYKFRLSILRHVEMRLKGRMFNT